LQKQYKAFSYYHLPDNRVVGLWKHALTGISIDNGKSWSTVARAPGFVNAAAKIWGQRTNDGRYATVYNPSEYRWPLALSVSKDGLEYTNLLLVNGEITPMRYGGNYKSYGPQYVRGIEEGNGVPTDGNLWVTYSMNKEDIWVSSIPIPVQDKAAQPVNDSFPALPAASALKDWNIYSPLWAPVSVAARKDGARWLTLEDKDPFDYAKAERLFPAASKLEVAFTVAAAQRDHGCLQIELQDGKGIPAIRLVFDADSVLKAKAGARDKHFMPYLPDTIYNIRLSINTTTRFYTINVNGKDVLTSLLFAPADKLERIMFRTGKQRHFPDADTPADQYYDLPKAGEQEPKTARYFIRSLKINEG
jgi:hypothetical protein